MRTTRTHRHRRAAVALALTAALASTLVGCGGDDAPADNSADTSAEVDRDGAVDAAEDNPMVPDECAEPFPLAYGGGELSDLTLRPEDWPDPFPDAVLCGTTATVDESQQEADFAVEADEEEVLSSFESALASLDGYQTSREDPSGLGRQMLGGSAGDTYFQVIAKSGGYTVSFGREAG